jgi:hypothetical protein
VEQFQLETEKAAAEEMLAMRNVPLGVHFGVTLEAFSGAERKRRMRRLKKSAPRRSSRRSRLPPRSASRGGG